VSCSSQDSDTDFNVKHFYGQLTEKVGLPKLRAIVICQSAREALLKN